MKRCKLFIVVFMIILSVSVYAEPINLINEYTYIQQDTNASFEDGVFSMSSIEGEYVANFSVPNLTNSYTWSGDVTVIDIDESVPYSGVRFCIGYDVDTSNYINLIITRSIGVSADQRGTNPVSDVYPVSSEIYKGVLTDGCQFHFEIIRDDTHVILKIDGAVVIDFNLTEEFNLFTEGDELNLGFYTCMCSYEVRNLAVYDEDVVITPKPSPTEVTTATPKPQLTATQTKTADTTQRTNSDTDDNTFKIKPIVIIVTTAAVVMVAVTAFVLMKKKKS